MINERSRIGRFFALSGAEKRVFTEALLTQVIAGLLLKIIPFRWIPRAFASPQSSVNSQQSAVSSVKTADINMIKTALERAGRISPWKNRCLVSSLAARCMLRRRRINSILSLGVTKDTDGSLKAHAWISSGDVEIVKKSGEYTELYTF